MPTPLHFVGYPRARFADPPRPRRVLAPVSIRTPDPGIQRDGPFAETREQMAGLFIDDGKDLDEALEVAVKVPAAWYGAIEVRPVWET